MKASLSKSKDPINELSTERAKFECYYISQYFSRFMLGVQ